MRLITAVMLACLLVACSDLPRAPGLGCSSAYECEVQGYARAGH